MSDLVERQRFDLDTQIGNLEAISQVLLHFSTSEHLDKDEQRAIGWLAISVYDEVRMMRKTVDGQFAALKAS